MLAVSVILAAAVVAGAVLGLRRRRTRRPGLEPLPAGVKHLATTVSDLSDLGLHLASRRGAVLPQKPRLGALLDLRS
jgi:hypothetical protein